MKKIVPLHSLVIVIDYAELRIQDEVKELFNDYEIIDLDTIRYDLVGDISRPDISVYNELVRRVEVKLKMGERVIVCVKSLRKDNRISLASLGVQYGCPVFYFVGNTPDTSSMERDILRGDGLAEVINTNMSTVITVNKLPDENTLEYLRDKFLGITIIGDVHGMHNTLQTAIEWARDRNHFLISLGDVLDYGSGSLECIDEFYRLVMRGRATMIIGNHERKIVRWIDNSDKGRQMMKLSEGNKVTTTALLDMGPSQRDKWVGRYKGLIAQSRYYRRIGNFVLAHAGIHPSYWTDDLDVKAMDNYCLFGEVVTDTTGKMAHAYDWIEEIPHDTTVLVGHEIRSTFKPHTVTNSKGSSATFMDTGCGKGGSLSSVDLKFVNGGLAIQNFNIH